MYQRMLSEAGFKATLKAITIPNGLDLPQRYQEHVGKNLSLLVSARPVGYQITE